MAYMGTGVSLRDSIHTDSSTGISGWNTHRTALTGEFTRNGGNISGRYGEFSKDIQEYNRKIDTLSGAWQDTGMFLTPYNAGFRYTGTGDFNKWDTYSLDFDGADDYVDCGTAIGDALGDNYAGSLTVSLWFKAVDTDSSDGMFYIGSFSGSFGKLIVLVGTDKLLYYLNGWPWRREVAFTDTTSWHHLVCVYATGDEANSKMYLDGTAVGTAFGTFPSAADMDFAGLKTIIGAYYSTIFPFEGKMDEVAIWDSALSAEQITAIYNGGTPRSLAPYSPLAWWRMGDGLLDDGGERLIGDQMNLTFGNELLTNGDFSDASVPDTWNGSAPVNLVGWTSGGSAYTATAHFVITDGKCRLISDGTNIILNGGTCVVGKTYKYSYEVTDVTTGGFTIIGGGVTLGLNITSVGTYTGVFTAASTTAMAINRNAGTTDATIANVSVKEFNGYVGRMKNMTASDIVADTP